MADDNKDKLNEQLFRCILDDKLSTDKKLKKMEYILRLGADVNALHEFGFSALSVAKMTKNESVIQFLENNGGEEKFLLDKDRANSFFNKTSVEDMNNFLKLLPDGYVLDFDIHINMDKMKELPDLSRFFVKGDFICAFNKLTSLKGAPREVSGIFNCSCNELETLEGAPSKVGIAFDCFGNKLKTLKGGPKKVGWNFSCNNNNLVNLVGAPKLGEFEFDWLDVPLYLPEDMDIGFYCCSNELKSLEGAPEYVRGNFRCSYNKLENLIGAPRVITNRFECKNNELTTIEGAYDVVCEIFDYSKNKITSFDKKPKNARGIINDEKNFIDRLFQRAEKSKRVEKVMNNKIVSKILERIFD